MTVLRAGFTACVPGCALLLCTAATASAQATAGFAGTVRDATGAVLPGVTVEASSPALIEKVRVAMTDVSGGYQIVALPSGAYNLTFTLAGFTVLKREGLRLTAGFTATIDAELRISAVSETITVSGQAPVVDVRNVRREDVISRELLDALPTGKIWTEMASLMPSVQSVDSGRGTSAMGGAASRDNFPQLTAYGARTGDTIFLMNGNDVTMFGQTNAAFLNPGDGNVQEYGVEVSAHSVQSDGGGVRVNVVTKDGGNRYTGTLFANYAGSGFASTNMTAELKALGLRDPDKLNQLWTVNPSAGGPILRDRLWFYGSFSRMYGSRLMANTYVNTTPGAWQPTFDFSRQAEGLDDTRDYNIRLTYQASPRNKLAFYYQWNSFCQCTYGIGKSYIAYNMPEASSRSERYTKLPQLFWTSPVSSRLLFEASLSNPRLLTIRKFQPETVAPRISETTTGYSFRAPTSMFQDVPITWDPRASVSYVTGTHAFKVGFDGRIGDDLVTNFMYGDQQFSTLNFRPTSVTYFATPYTWDTKGRQVGVYAEDKWNLNRWTLNLGLRYDRYRQFVPAQHLIATQFVPTARDLPGSELFDWQDLSPRLGAAYDVFGNGKTAIKASLSRFLVRRVVSGQLNPAAQNTTMVRSWTDPNGDFIIQGDPLNPLANGELGASNNRNFGLPVVSVTIDPDFGTGFGNRDYNWESAVSMQHELLPGVGATVSYHWRWYGNFQITDNSLVAPSDYDTYCVTAPIDTRLPGDASGTPICGLFDLKPAKLGLVQNVITSSANYGDQKEHWNGGDVTLQARVAGGLLLNGGVSFGKSMLDNCDVVVKVDNPSLRNCHVETPYNMQVKISGVYVLPWKVEVAAAFQSFNGQGKAAVATFTNAQVSPSLGRNLSSGVTVDVPLLATNAVSLATGNAPQFAHHYWGRVNQLDLRFGKTFRIRQLRAKAMLDLYNALNTNTPTAYSSAYGTTGTAWGVPLGIMLPRYAKIGVQLDF